MSLQVMLAALGRINASTVLLKVRQEAAKQNKPRKHAERPANISERSTNFNVTLSGAVAVEVMLKLPSVVINVVCRLSESRSWITPQFSEQVCGWKTQAAAESEREQQSGCFYTVNLWLARLCDVTRQSEGKRPIKQQSLGITAVFTEITLTVCEPLLFEK